jgi:hypothetical protein
MVSTPSAHLFRPAGLAASVGAPRSGKSSLSTLPALSSTSTPQFGHGITHDSSDAPPAGKEKRKGPLKLIIWGIADVFLLTGSVFFADMIVPEHDHHHHNHTTQTDHPPTVKGPHGHSHSHDHTHEPEEESTGHFARLLQMSGIAAGLHMLSHVGLAGGWFLYGRSRGARKRDEQNCEVDQFRGYAEKLAKEGQQFRVESLPDGAFKIVPLTADHAHSCCPAPTPEVQASPTPSAVVAGEPAPEKKPDPPAA